MQSNYRYAPYSNTIVLSILISFFHFFLKKLRHQLQKRIRAIHLHADQMQYVTVVFVHVYQNIMVTHTEDVDLSVR